MTNRLRFAIVPCYILLCVVLGGSAQGIWTNAVLQLLAVAMIAWAVLDRAASPVGRSAKSLAAIAGLVLLLIGLQLIPLPPAIWSALPGRAFLGEGFALLGIAPPWLPLSLSPHDTMATALTLLPPIAVLAAMLLTGAYRSLWLAVTILCVALAAILVGALQVGSADPFTSAWYFYERTNHGVATGFFANSSHMAALLMIGVPTLFAVVRDLQDRSKNAKASSAIMLLGGAGVVVLLLGIALNESMAIVLLGPPVVLMSASLFFAGRVKVRRALAAAAVLSGAAMLALYLSPLHDRVATNSTTSIEERRVMWAQSAVATGDFMPLGSGLGSFAALYPRYEDSSAVSRTFTSHAHNDFVEIVLETGVPGIVLLIAFLAWWVARTRSIWSSKAADPYAQAATIVTAALLLHSLVEFPLRTAALSGIMAACLAIMARPSGPRSSAGGDLWPTRHVKI